MSKEKIKIVADNGVRVEILRGGERVIVTSTDGNKLWTGCYTDIQFDKDGKQKQTWIGRGWDKCKTKVRTWVKYGEKNRKTTLFGSSEFENTRVQVID